MALHSVKLAAQNAWRHKRTVALVGATALLGAAAMHAPDAISAARFQYQNRQLAHRVGSSLREQRDAERAAYDAAYNSLM